MKILSTLICLSAFAFGSLHAHVEVYKIDPVHSSVKFSIRHFVAKTTGSFGEFEGTITINTHDYSQSKVVATVKIPSVDTDNEKRDAHLREEEYFNASEHPVMSFESTKWEATDKENHFKVTGKLTLRGVTKFVVLNVELLGFGEGMKGAYLSGWEATTTLNRTEWGVSAGTPAVGEEVDVTINIEAIRQSSEEQS